MVAAVQDVALASGEATGIGVGASVRTPLGPRRVEHLRRGDLVVTRDHGLQPVRLVWRRRVTQAEMAAEAALAPVRLGPRAVGPMMPRRGFLLAGGHRALVPACRIARDPDGRGRLVAARELAGLDDSSFIDRAPETVTFVTFVFDCHEVIEVEGLPVESFQATAAAISRLNEDHRLDLLRLFPELARSPSAYPPAEYRTATAADLRAPAG